MHTMEINTDRYIVHTKPAVYMEAVLTFIMVGVLIYYTNGSRKIPNELQHNVTTIMLKVYLGVMWAGVVCRIARLKSRWQIMERRISYDLWRRYALEYMFPFKYYYPLMIISCGIEFYFVTIFVPIKINNCAVYGENKEVCDVFNTIIISYLIWPTIIILMLFGSCLCYVCAENIRENQNDNLFIARISDIAGFTQPVIVTASENTCTICLDDATQTDTQWAQLRCGHTFHPDCINHWLSLNPICPTCRTPATTNIDNNVSMLSV